MSDETMTQDDLLKALEDMDTLLTKSQIVTGPGSSKGTMKEEKLSEDDKIDNGTDYSASGKGKKMSKAQTDEGADDAAENDVVEDEEKSVKKGGKFPFDKMDMKEDKKDDKEVVKAKKDEDDEEEESVDEDEEKALSGGSDKLTNTDVDGDRSGGSETLVHKGMDDDDSFDVAGWLYEFAHAVNKALVGMEARIEDKLSKAQDSQGDMSKGMADIAKGLDDQIQARLESVEDIEKSAARAPKSVLRAGDADIAKSKAPVITDKPAVSRALFKAMQDGKVTPLDVVRFDSTGQIHPELLKSLGVESAIESV